MRQRKLMLTKLIINNFTTIMSLGEDCPAIARLLNYKKEGRRGRRPGRRKTVINRAALYPQVTIDTNKTQGKKGKGVKQEQASKSEYAQDEEEEHEVIQTHSGRRVKKPNYKKWFLVDDDDDEDTKPKPIQSALLNPANEEEEGPPASPTSEPEWSSEGRSDKDFQDSSSESSSEDFDFGNSDEENDYDDENYDGGDGSPSRKGCSKCSRTFADEEKKDKHFKRYHQPGGRIKRKKSKGGISLRTHTCEHCEKEFKRPNLLRRHIEKDHGIFPDDGESLHKKKHVCEFCGQKYRNGSELRVHVRLHTGETPFKCDHCDQSFVSALKRETHIEQCHWDVPPLKCEFCDRAFFCQHRLRIHRITHTGERAYLCEICRKHFLIQLT